jgi:hypothetical protein
MGWGSYEVARNGLVIEAGYLVSDVCNRPDCKVEINRGGAFLCGSVPGGAEYGCGSYFCADHLYFPLGEIAKTTTQGLCDTCWNRWSEKGWRVEA